MSNIIVVGAQWGDEGKGKIVDLLCDEAEIIVRFQGGHNAGHTLVVGSKVFKLSLLPSGIIRDGKVSVIGNGVIVDPIHLTQEIKDIKFKKVNITSKKLILSESSFLILPIHKHIDNLRESVNSDKKIGTTGRGIGPAYEDKVGRRGLKISDFSNKKVFKEKFKKIYDFHNIWIKFYKGKECEFEKDFEQISNALEALQTYVGNTWLYLNECIKDDKNILYEGAQGTFLDIDFGTYPFVTSSNTISGNATVGSGVGPSHSFYILGITKAYTTRVGNGPFPTEETGKLGQLLAIKGKEVGTVTGRKRRCGWFDAVLLKQAIKISGISGLALTKLDILDDFDQIKLCVGYKMDDKEIDYFPANQEDQKKIKPIYKIFSGWKSKTFGLTQYEKLPNKAKLFLKEIENLVECKIDIISTGPDRDHTIILKKYF